MEAGVSAGERDLKDSIATFSPVAGSSGGSRQRESLESGDPEDIEALWLKHVESQKSSTDEDSGAKRMIESWRRARDRDDRGIRAHMCLNQTATFPGRGRLYCTIDGFPCDPFLRFGFQDSDRGPAGRYHRSAR